MSYNRNANHRPPRLPTVDELQAHFDYLLSLCEQPATPRSRDTCTALVDDARTAVFDHFMPDCPGYTGRIMVCVYTAGPEAFEVFTFNKEGKLDRVTQDVAR